MGSRRIFNILVLASGSGTTFDALVKASQSSDCGFRICGLLTNKPGIGALQLAEGHQVPTKVVSSTQLPLKVWENQLTGAMKEFSPDLIVLAGFLKRVPLAAVNEFKGKIINTHPSLLPKFGGQGMYGRNVHNAVLASGEQVSGITIHWVSENYDEGAIIGQSRVSLVGCESAADVEKKVQSQEKPFLVQTITELLKEWETRL